MPEDLGAEGVTEGMTEGVTEGVDTIAHHTFTSEMQPYAMSELSHNQPN